MAVGSQQDGLSALWWCCRAALCHLLAFDVTVDTTPDVLDHKKWRLSELCFCL